MESGFQRGEGFVTLIVIGQPPIEAPFDDSVVKRDTFARQ